MNYLLVSYSPDCRIRGELVTEHQQDQLYKMKSRDFPGGPVVMSL